MEPLLCALRALVLDAQRAGGAVEARPVAARLVARQPRGAVAAAQVREERLEAPPGRHREREDVQEPCAVARGVEDVPRDVGGLDRSFDAGLLLDGEVRPRELVTARCSSAVEVLQVEVERGDLHQHARAELPRSAEAPLAHAREAGPLFSVLLHGVADEVRVAVELAFEQLRQRDLGEPRGHGVTLTGRAERLAVRRSFSFSFSF